MNAHRYPWRLRLWHEGFASIRGDRAGRPLRFDPATPPAPQDIVVLTGCSAEALFAVRAAVAAGARPTVVADAAVLAWLALAGAVDGHPGPTSIDGLSIDVLSVDVAPPTPWAELPWRVVGAARGPVAAAARVWRGARAPVAPARVVGVVHGDGPRLVHLGLSLHGGVSDAWVAAAAARFGGADPLVAGVLPGEGGALLRHLPAFGARKVLLTDLVADNRAARGLGTPLLTPTCDAAVAAGHEAYLFVSGAGIRLE